MRELQEELSATVQPVRRLWKSVTPWGVELAWWLAELDEKVPLVANSAEVAAIHWLSIDEMEALEELLESNREFLSHLRAGAIAIR